MTDIRDAIKRFDIVAFSSQFVDILRDYGTDVIANCPICGGNKKLYISRNKRIVRCFTCDDLGLGGTKWNGRADLISWIMLLRGCSRGAAIREVFDGAGIVSAPVIQVERDYSFPPEALRISKSCDPSHPCRVELRRRKLEHMMDHWYMCPTGKYAGRYLLPIRFFGRQFGYEAKSYTGATPKSLSVCEPNSLYSSVCWDKSRPFAVITESVFDAETVGVNAIGLLGSALSGDRWKHLYSLQKQGITELVWLLDSDAWRKQRRMIARFSAFYFTNKFAELPPGEDPNSFGMAACWDRIDNAVVIRTEYDMYLNRSLYENNN